MNIKNKGQYSSFDLKCLRCFGNCGILNIKKEYPIPKQVKPKLNTAISSKISIGSALLSPDFLTDFYVIGGSQSLQRGLTAYHLGISKEILP